jgi:curli production assembly/transport component CsgG
MSPRFRSLCKIATNRFCISFLVLSQLTACASVAPSNPNSRAVLTPPSKITYDLLNLPLPKAKVTVAVYGLRDQTGQYKPSPDSSFSNSVTQGAASMLVKALKDSGWYIPVEREGLQNLLTERKVVRAVESPTKKGKPNIDLPSLLPASLIVEGGVIAYESNVRTGGAGANYLGIGANSSYRVDQVTVTLRLVDTRNGQILGVTTVTKTIYSFMLSTSIFAFKSFQHLLQGEAGFSSNEPVQLGVRQALEAAVIHLTLQGVRDRFLDLKDEQAIFSPLVQKYLQADRGNSIDPDEGFNAPMTLIGFSALPSESHSGMVKPMVLSPAVVVVQPTKPLAPAEKPAANPVPDNSNQPVVKSTMEQL